MTLHFFPKNTFVLKTQIDSHGGSTDSILPDLTRLPPDAPLCKLIEVLEDHNLEGIAAFYRKKLVPLP